VIASYEYFPGSSRLKTVTYPDGSQYKFEYLSQTVISENRTYLTTVRDALNNILEFHEYDTFGRATTSEKQGGVEKYTIDYTHSTDSVPYTTVTEARQNVTKYYFDKTNGRNVLTKSEGLCNCGGGSEVTQYFYDAKLNQVKKIDALGREMNYTFDTNGNRLTMTDVLGTQSYTYNSFGQMLTMTDRMNGVTTNTYSPTGNLLTTTDALGKTTTYTYNPNGQLLTVTDARSKVTSLTWTGANVTKITDANTKETNFVYDARSRLTAVTNALNFTTNYEYDLANRLKKVTHPDGKFEETGYDLAGRRTSVTDGRGFVTTFGYDGAYRLTTVTDALNHTTSYGYDLMSNLVTTTDAEGKVTSYEYDEFNRLKKIVHPPSAVGQPNLTEQWEYDQVGNVKKRIDMAGRETLYDYDAAYRLMKVTDALNQITQFEYNARSQMTKVKDALNQEYLFAYDALGRQLSQSRAGGTMSYEYDAVGNRTKRTDYLGRITTYQYDNLNRLKKIIYPNTAENVTLTYDVLSRLQLATNQNGTVDFNYNSRNRLTQVTDTESHLLNYTYDGNGNRKTLKIDGVLHTSYTYDRVNRLQLLTDETDLTQIDFNYDVVNQLTRKVLPNGISTSYVYDGMDRLTRIRDFTTATNTTLNNRLYSYNNANQISQIKLGANIRNFGYDGVDRLTSVTGSATENYAFDAVGNRTSSHLSSSYSYQPFNKLTNTATASYVYDANGNMTSKTDSNGTWTYSWDCENRLTSASNGTVTVNYSYDALGRSIKRTKGTDVSKFTYDGLDVVRDDENGVITTYQNGLGIDNKLKMTSGGVSKYFLQDHLGSTTGLVYSSGTITNTASYDGFGNSVNNLGTRYQYTGREYDADTGLYFYRARWYDSQIGRFISEDPIGFAGGDVNLYGYVGNHPLKFIDPQGTDFGTSATIGGGALIGAGSSGLAIGVAATAGGIVVGGAAAIYFAWEAGEYIASVRYPEQYYPPNTASPPIENEGEGCQSKPVPTTFVPPLAIPMATPSSTPRRPERCDGILIGPDENNPASSAYCEYLCRNSSGPTRSYISRDPTDIARGCPQKFNY
jgi:RHS repeat-associated protein